MPMKTETIYNALSQLLLLDPAAEEPMFHSGKLKLPKRQMIRRLELLVEEYKEAEIDIDLSPFTETIDYLRSLKTAQEYERVIHEIIEANDPNVGVVIEENATIEELKTKRNEYLSNQTEEQEEEISTNYPLL